MAYTDSLSEFMEAVQAGRLLGLDLGSKTIGLALSDTERMVATPMQTLARGKFSADAAALLEIIAEQEVRGLVCGLPLNMDGTSGVRVQATRAFVRNLTNHSDFNLPILLWDERLSTIAVERTLLEADISRQKRSEVIDKMAASYILQGVLDSKK